MSGFDKFAWIKAVYADPTFTPGEKAVLSYVANFYVLYTDDPPVFCVRQSTIADRTGITRATVSTAINRAKRLGYVVVSCARKRGYGRSAADELMLSLPLNHSQSDVKNPYSTRQSDVKQTTELCQATAQSDVKQTTELCQAANAVTCENDTPKGLYKGLVERFGEGSGEDAAPGGHNAEPLDADIVPDSHDAPTPQNLLETQNQQPVYEAEFVDPLPTEPPSPFCSNHPNGTDKPCGACGRKRREAKEHDSKHIARMLLATNAEKAAREEERARTKAARPKCHVCRDTDIVLNSDLRPGSDPRWCHHDNTWHSLTAAQRVEYAELLKRLDEGRTA